MVSRDVVNLLGFCLLIYLLVLGFLIYSDVSVDLMSVVELAKGIVKLQNF